MRILFGLMNSAFLFSSTMCIMILLLSVATGTTSATSRWIGSGSMVANPNIIAFNSSTATRPTAGRRPQTNDIVYQQQQLLLQHGTGNKREHRLINYFIIVQLLLTMMTLFVLVRISFVTTLRSADPSSTTARTLLSTPTATTTTTGSSQFASVPNSTYWEQAIRDYSYLFETDSNGILPDKSCASQRPPETAANGLDFDLCETIDIQDRTYRYRSELDRVQSVLGCCGYLEPDDWSRSSRHLAASSKLRRGKRWPKLMLAPSCCEHPIRFESAPMAWLQTGKERIRDAGEEEEEAAERERAQAFIDNEMMDVSELMLRNADAADSIGGDSMLSNSLDSMLQTSTSRLELGKLGNNYPIDSPPTSSSSSAQVGRRQSNAKRSSMADSVGGLFYCPRQSGSFVQGCKRLIESRQVGFMFQLRVTVLLLLGLLFFNLIASLAIHSPEHLRSYPLRHHRQQLRRETLLGDTNEHYNRSTLWFVNRPLNNAQQLGCANRSPQNGCNSNDNSSQLTGGQNFAGECGPMGVDAAAAAEPIGSARQQLCLWTLIETSGELSVGRTNK